MTDLVGKIIDYESGMMTYDEVIQFFQELVDTGTVLNLQGHYQRTAAALLEQGVISNERPV